MGVSEIGFPQNVVYKQRIQTSDTLPVTIGASKYCEFLFDIDSGDRMTPLGIVGWGCNDKTQVFLLDFYLDNDLQTAKLILKNPYATTIAISSLYIDVLYSKQGLDMSEVDVVDNLTTDSAVAALSARQGKLLNDAMNASTHILPNDDALPSGTTENGPGSWLDKFGCLVIISFNLKTTASNPVDIPGFIPAGYRPKNSISIVLSDGGGSNVTIGKLSTDGSVTLYFGSTKCAQGSVAYFIA